MISKRLGILILALATVWCLAGLDWSAPAGTKTSVPVIAVNSAHAGQFDFLGGLETNSYDGDPDQYANSMDGDPDQYAGGSGRDSTQTDEQADEQKDPDFKLGAVLNAIARAADLLF